MSAPQTVQIQPPPQPVHDHQRIDLSDMTSVMVIALIVWIFNKHVSDVGKRFERESKAMIEHFDLVTTMIRDVKSRADDAHNKINEHIQKEHTK